MQFLHPGWEFFGDLLLTNTFCETGFPSLKCLSRVVIDNELFVRLVSASLELTAELQAPYLFDVFEPRNFSTSDAVSVM